MVHRGRDPRSEVRRVLSRGGRRADAADLQARLAGGQGEVLGTLASYLHDVAYRGGLPWSATLAATAPLDHEIGAVVAADRRLGFFHTLRLGDGNYAVYARLIAAGLRHVDASRHAILAALMAGQRRELTRLSNVRFATREVNEALADATFDRVREIETEMGVAAIAKFLAFVIRDELQIFARAPRRLVLRERGAPGDALVSVVLAAWDRLPLAGIEVAGLRRDGTASAGAHVSAHVRGLASARFRLE